jgi:integrase
MAHVRLLSRKQDGSRRYQVRYVGPDGRERAKTFGRRADADRFAASVETDKARGEWIDPRLGRTTVADWAEGWLARLAHVQPKTRVGYESLLRTCVLPAFGTTPLARVEQPAVAAWVAEMRARGLSPSRIRQAYRVMSSLMAAAVQGGYLARSPCTGIRLPRAARRDATLLTAAEVDRLADAAGAHGTLIYLLAYGGLRWGEVAALRRRRCDLLRRRVEVAEAVSDVNGRLVYGPTKTFERRWVRLPDFLAEQLARQLEGVGADPDELVFRGQRGAPLRYQSFRRAVWDRAVADAGLSDGVTPHCLRHTCASLLIASGADPVAVQRHLGHRDVTTTMNIYAGLFPNRLDEIAEALDGLYRAAQSAN